MRHQKRGRKLNRSKPARKSLFRNLAASIVLHEKVKTTEAKAKEIRAYVDKAIILGKKSSYKGKQQLHQLLGNKEAEAKIMKELAKRYESRTSGFTRITRVGSRLGDNAMEVIIELV